MNNINKNEEIDLKEIFILLFNRKYLILIFTLVFFLYGFFYIRNSLHIFEVSIETQPVSGVSAIQQESGLLGLLSSSSNRQSDSIGEFMKLFKSHIVAKKLYENDIFKSTVFGDQFNLETKSWNDIPSDFKPYKVRNFFRRLLNYPEKLVAHPDVASVRGILSSIEVVQENSSLGFTFIYKTHKPKIGVYILKNAIEITDMVLKERTLNSLWLLGF